MLMAESTDSNPAAILLFALNLLGIPCGFPIVSRYPCGSHLKAYFVLLTALIVLVVLEH